MLNSYDTFCNAMVSGLAIQQVSVIANQLGLDTKKIRDPRSIINKTLGIPVEDKENTWMFVVAAPMTLGEHACSVYHNYQVVISASILK